MQSINDIREELRGMNSPLADMSRAMPYELPNGYFEDFSQLLHMMKAGKEMPYAVPQGYFEGLSAAIMAKTEGVSVMRPNPYNVPQGYFEGLPEAMLARVKESDMPVQTKVIPLGTRIWKNIRWAAAAVLITGIGLGVYRSYMTDTSVSPQQELSALSKEDIHSYVEQRLDEFDVEAIAANTNGYDVKTITNNLSEEEIENYLNETGGAEAELN